MLGTRQGTEAASAPRRAREAGDEGAISHRMASYVRGGWVLPRKVTGGRRAAVFPGLEDDGSEAHRPEEPGGGSWKRV